MSDLQFYKIISSDNKSCNGGNFDWTEYLPQNNEPGKWTPVIEDINLCSRGYHVTPYPCMWVCDKTDRIFLVECQDIQEEKNTGTVDKVVAKSIRLVKEIFFNYDDELNSGNRNSGSYNSGSNNSGHNNSGHRNSGYHNSDSYNSGNYNSGNNNSGNNNSGSYNSGNHNSGNGNSGSYNSGNYHTGFFNSLKTPSILVFNKPCSLDVWEKAQKPDFLRQLESSTHAEWTRVWENTDPIDRELVKQLPNFDPDIFFEITGIKLENIPTMEK